MDLNLQEPKLEIKEAIVLIVPTPNGDAVVGESMSKYKVKGDY